MTKLHDRITCKGKGTPILNAQATGGHMEDYISDPEHIVKYGSNLKWVPVSQSFKKSDD